MKQILVKLFISLKQAIVSLFKKRGNRVKIDSNHDGDYDIIIEFEKLADEEPQGGKDDD